MLYCITHMSHRSENLFFLYYCFLVRSSMGSSITQHSGAEQVNSLTQELHGGSLAVLGIKSRTFQAITNIAKASASITLT